MFKLNLWLLLFYIINKKQIISFFFFFILFYSYNNYYCYCYVIKMSTLTYEHANYFVYNKKKMQLNGHLLSFMTISHVLI